MTSTNSGRVSYIHQLCEGSASASWVIRNRATRAVIMETFDPRLVDSLNTIKYEAVPIMQYLQELSQEKI